jgi:5-methylcytosine-specific restriction endonuclease McrA
MPTILSRHGPCREWPNCECPKCNRHALKLERQADKRAGGSRIVGDCHYCGEPATTRDHVVPVSKGGRAGNGNIVPACNRCNQLKGSMDYREFMGLMGKKV